LDNYRQALLNQAFVFAAGLYVFLLIRIVSSVFTASNASELSIVAIIASFVVPWSLFFIYLGFRFAFATAELVGEQDG